MVKVLSAWTTIYKIFKPISKLTLICLCIHKNAKIVSSLGDGVICIINKFQLTLSSSRFMMRRISISLIEFLFRHPNLVRLDAYKSKYMQTAIHDF